MMQSLDRISLLTLAAGLILALTLPVGALYPAPSLIAFIFIVHFLLHLSVVGLSLWSIFDDVRISGRHSIIPVAIIVVALSTTILFSLLPITARDSLIYHLAVPKLWLQAGQIHEMAWFDWSYFPLHLSLGYGALLATGLESWAPFYHGSYLIILAALCGGTIRHVTRNPLYAVYGFALTVTVPLFSRLASEPLADLALAVYFSIATVELILWSDDTNSKRRLALLGCALGLALSCKYTSLLAFALFGPLVCWVAIRAKLSTSQIFYSIAVVFGLALLCFAPWAIKNAIWVGDPLYPFLSNFFSSEEDYSFIGALPPIPYRHVVYGESWFEIALLPFRIFFTGADGTTKTFDGVLSPLFLTAFFLMRYRSDLPIWVKPVGTIAALHLIVAPFLHHLLSRYHAPFFFVGILFLVLGAFQLLKTSALRRQSMWMMVMLSAQCSLFILYSMNRAQELDLSAYLSKKLTVQQYLSAHVSEYALAQLLDERLPHDSNTLLLYTGNRFFLYKNSVRGEHFAIKPILRILDSSSSVPDIIRSFEEERITHLAAHVPRTTAVLQRVLPDGERRRALWTEFATNHLFEVGRSGPYMVWKIVK